VHLGTGRFGGLRERVSQPRSAAPAGKYRGRRTHIKRRNKQTVVELLTRWQHKLPSNSAVRNWYCGAVLPHAYSTTRRQTDFALPSKQLTLLSLIGAFDMFSLTAVPFRIHRRTCQVCRQTGQRPWAAPLAGTAVTAGRQHWPSPLVAAGRRHWPGALATCSRRVGDDDADDDDDGDGDGDGDDELTLHSNMCMHECAPHFILAKLASKLDSNTGQHHWPAPQAAGRRATAGSEIGPLPGGRCLR